MKRLALLVIAVGVAWSGWWFWQAHLARTSIDAWFEARRADGWTAQYGDLAVRGFPNRVDVTLTDLAITAPDDGVRVRAPFLQIFRLVYNPGHHIIAFPNTMTIGPSEITSDGLRASLIEDDGTILRANAEAAVLNIDGPDGTVALAGFTAGVQTVATAPQTYRIGLSADSLAGPASPTAPAQGDGLGLRAEVSFDRVWHLGNLSEDRPQPTDIDLDMLQYQVSDMLLKLAGSLTVDDQGRGDGDLTLRAENWRSLLADARDRGQLPTRLADTLEEGLALYSRMTGNGQTLDLPLRFDLGRVSVGPIPLGEGPRFRLP